MPGARDGQLRIHRGADDPPWTITLYDDAAGQERLPLGRITIEEWLARREEAIEMRWAGEFNPRSQYFTGDVVRAGGPQYVCLAPPVPRLDTRVDTFTRADQSGWGTASDGNVWVAAGTPTPGLEFIASDTGTAATDASDNANTLALGGALASSDVELLVRWAVTTGVDDQDGVQLYLALLTSALNVQVRLDGDINLFNASTFNHDFPGAWAGGTAGTLYWTRCRNDGGVITVRTWADGTSEPAGADVDWDSGTAFAAGSIALANLANNALTTVSFDSLDARMLAPAVLHPSTDGTHWQRSAA